jgi:N6-adenosine-specific RNA methylase IME4/ParB-like chromosome segregation protein Spo0J
MNDLTGKSNFQVMPPLSESDYKALKEDIAERGVMIPIEYDEDGNVLDGHHRIKICGELGIEDWPRFIRKGLSDSEKKIHAQQLNLARRQLTRQQREELWADMRRNGMSYRQIADVDGTVNATTIMRATVANATVEQPEMVKGKDGKSRKPMRTTFLDSTPGGEKEALDVAKSIRANRAEISRENRIERIAEISKGNADLDTSIKYPVIYADPPWRYENPPMGGTNRSIENHYPTMTLEEICALPVDNLATDDAILYLWATAPKLAECMKVITAWGFEYRTNIVWDKEKIGMGYHARNQHELLLIAKRGQIPSPKPGTQPPSVIRSPRGRHSEKPLQFYLIINRCYPGLPKIELFHRSKDGKPPAPEFTAWGNQSVLK